jgi:hypothetical protein
MARPPCDTTLLVVVYLFIYLFYILLLFLFPSDLGAMGVGSPFLSQKEVKAKIKV